MDKSLFSNAFDLFEKTSPVFIALGEPIRQQLILDLASATIENKALSVADLTQLTHLSRPAVSHHLKILKSCGIIKPEKIGTQIFYKLCLRNKLSLVRELVNEIERLIPELES